MRSYLQIQIVIKMAIVEEVKKINKNTIKKINLVSDILFSVFLSYMVVIWFVIDFPERTFVLFLLFSFIYFLCLRKIIISKFEAIPSWLRRLNRSQIVYIKNANCLTLLASSFVIGISSIILMSLTYFYLYLADKTNLIDPSFSDYLYLAKIFPLKIYLGILSAITVYFISNTVLLSKIKKIKLAYIILFSFVSTVRILFVSLLAILIGVGIYFIGGSLLY